MSLGYLLVLLMAADASGLLPTPVAHYVDPLLAGQWWKFWIAVAVAYWLGYVPGSKKWFIHRLCGAFDRLEPQKRGLVPSLLSYFRDLHDIAAVTVIVIGAGYCYRWW
jgi:hypothetical protein